MVFFSSTQKTPQFFRPTYHWRNAGIFGIFVPGEAKSQGFLQGSSDFHIRGQPERLPAAGFSWWAHQDFLPSNGRPAVRGERRKIRSLCGSLKTSHRRGIRSQSATRFSALRGASKFSKYFTKQKKNDTEFDGAVRRRSRFGQRVPHRRPRCSKMPTRLPAKGLQRSVAEYKASAKKKTKELRSQVTGARGLAGG